MKWSEYSQRHDQHPEDPQPSRRLSVRRGQLRRDRADSDAEQARREPDELFEPLPDGAPAPHKPPTPDRSA